MITKVTAKNLETGDQVVMVLAYPELSEGFAITNIDGLGPGDATLNVNNWVTIDGGNFSYAHVPYRDISMTLRFISTKSVGTIPDVRRKTYKYFPLKGHVRLTFTTETGSGAIIDRFIEGYVKRNEPSIWSKEEETNIVISCPNPYFQNVSTYEGKVSSIDGKFHFEFPEETMEGLIGHTSKSKLLISEKLAFNERKVLIDTSVPVGGEFELEARGVVVNPTIYNSTTNEYFRLNYRMKPGESLLIDTRPTHKSITSADGTFTSKINSLALGSKWISFVQGENTIGVSADRNADKLILNYKIRSMYQGV